MSIGFDLMVGSDLRDLVDYCLPELFNICSMDTVYCVNVLTILIVASDQIFWEKYIYNT